MKRLPSVISRFLVSGLTLALFVPLGCGSEGSEAGIDGEPDVLSPEVQAQVDAISAEFDVQCPPGNSNTYANFGEVFMADWCLQCHSASVTADNRNGAPEDVNYDTVAQIRTRLLPIYQQAATPFGFMPPAGFEGPPNILRAILSDWLVCGAPE